MPETATGVSLTQYLHWEYMITVMGGGNKQTIFIIEETQVGLQQYSIYKKKYLLAAH